MRWISWSPAPLRVDDHEPDERLANDQGNEAAAPASKNGRGDDRDEDECEGRRVVCPGDERDPDQAEKQGEHESNAGFD